MTTQTATPSAAQAEGLMRMLSGYWVSQALYAIAKLHVPDQFEGEKVRTVAELASTLKVNEDFLYRVMRAVAGFGVFVETDLRSFKLGPMGTLLQSGHENSMHAVALMVGEEHYTAWGALHKGIETGKTPFEIVYGMQVFEYFEKHPEASETFNNAMTALVRNDHQIIASAYDFSRFNTLVDVGGGHGSLLISVLKKFPALKGIVFDLPHVAKNAAGPIEQANLQDRCTWEGGDFFKAVPQGADAYMMAHIVHDWSDELAEKFLRNIHAAMAESGRLLVAEVVVTPDNEPSHAKMMDLNMLVMTPGGRERTREEFAALFERAGFRLDQVIETPTGICLLECCKR